MMYVIYTHSEGEVVLLTLSTSILDTKKKKPNKQQQPKTQTNTFSYTDGQFGLWK